ncbi:MAG: hypothetical protein J6L64_05580 [Opitutales bacterium]|nr:hypothetical protein [Opitutales bacterium]
MSLWLCESFGGNGTLTACGIYSFTPGRRLAFARLPRAMLLLRLQRMFLPFGEELGFSLFLKTFAFSASKKKSVRIGANLRAKQHESFTEAAGIRFSQNFALKKNVAIP